MALPDKKIKKVKLPGDVDGSQTYEIIPERLQKNGHEASLPTLAADTTLLTSDAVEGYEPIIILEDNGTTTAGTWLAKTNKISALVEGQVFLYKVTVAGSTTTKLNITGSTGTALGAKTIYRYGSTKLTTQYPVGARIMLYYNGSTFTAVNDYDANSDTKVRQYPNVAGSGAKYPLLTRYANTVPSSTYEANYSRYHTDVTVDTSDGTLEAPTVNAADIVATNSMKLGNDDVALAKDIPTTLDDIVDGTTRKLSDYQKALPTTSTAGKVLKSTSTAGTVQWADDTNTNQTVKGNGTAFGVNDAIDIVGAGTVTVTADTTNKKITITGSAHTTDHNQTVKGNGTAFGADAAVNIVGGGATTVTADTANNKITISTQSVTDTNQTVKAGSTTFDANDVVNFEGSGIVSVTGDAVNDKITISASHQSIKTLDTTATTAQSTNTSEAIAGTGKITLHKVAKTGTYSDLIGKPTNVSQFTNDAGYITSADLPTNHVTTDTAQIITGLKTFSQRPLSKDIYTKLEYIRSNATSSTVFPYIRTGVKRGVDYTNSQILSCVLDGYFTASQTYGFCGYDSGGQLGQANGKWSTEAGTSSVSALTRATVTQVINFPSSYDRLYINGSQIANRTISSASSHAQSADYPLFVAYNGTFTYNPAKLVMYSFKMYIGDYATSPSTATLIRDFIPAKDPHGNIGLFDLVQQKFYKNSGNENFVAGDEVETFGIDSSLLTSYDVAKVAMTNDYMDLNNKPSISNAIITIKQTGISDQTFTLNGSAKTITLNDTTYESKQAASGGTDVSLVTTGEKYTWNNKSDLALGTTSTTAAKGNHTHTVTATGNVTLTNTGSTGTTYVESIGTPSVTNTSTQTAATEATAVSAVTGYPNFSAGSGSLTSNTTSSGGIPYLETVSFVDGVLTLTTKYLHHSHTGAALGTASTSNCAANTHTHAYDKTTAVSVTSTSKKLNASFSGTSATTSVPVNE